MGRRQVSPDEQRTSRTLTTTAIGGSTLDALNAQIPKRPKTFTNFATRYRPFKVGMKRASPSARAFFRQFPSSIEWYSIQNWRSTNDNFSGYRL